MLANPLPLERLDEVCTSDWAMERKIDGHRMLITTGPKGPAGWNRAGQRCLIPAHIRDVFRTVELTATFDGELANGTFHLFDMPALTNVVDHRTPWGRRNWLLSKLYEKWDVDDQVVDVVPMVRDKTAKLNLLREINDAGGEGVVFKRLGSTYQPGPRKSTDWFKYKLVQDVDVVLSAAGANGKQNFTIAMADPAGTITLPDGTKATEVGRVSALTGDGPRCKVGDVVKVTVTGLGSSRRLVEPVKPRRRTDKTPAECGLDQLDTLRRISR